MRHALLAPVGLLLLLLAPAARAEEEPAKAPAKPTPAPVRWIDGWAAGRAEAKERGTLVFLYFGRKRPP